jgi:hypothetical protein
MVLATLVSSLPIAVKAADMGIAPPALSAPADTETLTTDYLNRRAVLLMIRERFSLVGRDEIAKLLERDARRLGLNGPAPYDLDMLNSDLHAEASYYIVSLKYLTEAGGAAWPGDRPESAYANDALVALGALQVQLDEAIAAGLDPIQIMRSVQVVDAQTEGYSTVPSDRDHFSDRDELVETAMARGLPRANT